MTEKRWKIIDEEFISYTGGTAQLISNGECEVHLWERPKDAQLFCDNLNELHEENQFLKEKEKDMLDYLKKEYEYVYKQKIKHLDDAILANSYELIEYHIRSMIKHLERL